MKSAKNKIDLAFNFDQQKKENIKEDDKEGKAQGDETGVGGNDDRVARLESGETSLGEQAPGVMRRV